MISERKNNQNQTSKEKRAFLRYALEKFSESTKGLFDDFRNILILQDNDETDVLLIVSFDTLDVNINSNLAIAEKNNKNRDMKFEAAGKLLIEQKATVQSIYMEYTSIYVNTSVNAEKVNGTKWIALFPEIDK